MTKTMVMMMMVMMLCDCHFVIDALNLVLCEVVMSLKIQVLYGHMIGSGSSSG